MDLAELKVPLALDVQLTLNLKKPLSASLSKAMPNSAFLSRVFRSQPGGSTGLPYSTPSSTVRTCVKCSSFHHIQQSAPGYPSHPTEVTLLFSSFFLIQKQISREDKVLVVTNQSFRFKHW